MAVDPRGTDLKRYLQEDPGGPVVMLNLLRWADGGRASYESFWDRVEDVSVGSVRGTPPDGAEAVITYTYDDDRVVRERTSFRLVQQRGRLLIDDTSVISSSG